MLEGVALSDGREIGDELLEGQKAAAYLVEALVDVGARPGLEIGVSSYVVRPARGAR